MKKNEEAFVQSHCFGDMSKAFEAEKDKDEKKK